MLANKTLLQMKYARVIRLFADEANISYEEAMDKFYNSNTYLLMSEGIADMHCMSDGYLADELKAEYLMTEK